MPRPIKKRTPATYQRDIEHLGRLRTAIQIDDAIDADKSARAQRQIEGLVLTLVDLMSNSIVQGRKPRVRRSARAA